MHYKTCEICGLRSGRVLDHKRIFMAKFPLDEERCKKWVKVTGKEDLANIPIEKLHQLKHICGDHFRPKDFKKKKTQLKKTAVPSLLLTAKPLSDHILKGFPHHIHHSHIDSISSKKKKVVKNRSVDVSNDKQNQNVNDNSNQNQDASRQNITDNDNQRQDVNKIQIVVKTDIDDDEEHLNILDDDCETVDDDDLPFYPNTPNEPENIKPDEGFSTIQNLSENSLLHEGFLCNLCYGEIKGYRYTCVQCPSYDLCSLCEAKGEHCLHYVLRIPRPKPLAEIQSVLNEIRKQLLVETPEDTGQVTEIKEELKQEDDGDLWRSDDAITHVHDRVVDTSRSDNVEDNYIVPDMRVQPLLRTCLHNATKDTRTDKVPFDKKRKNDTDLPETNINPSETVVKAEQIDDISNESFKTLNTDVSKRKLDEETNTDITLKSNAMKKAKYPSTSRLKENVERKSHTDLPETNINPSETVVKPEQNVDISDESCEKVNTEVSKRKLDEVAKPVITLKKNAMKEVKMVVCQTPKDARSIGINLSTDQEYFNTCIKSETTVAGPPPPE